MLNEKNQNNNLEKINNDLTKQQIKFKNIVVLFFSFVLIILIILGITLGIHFSHNKKHNNPNPAPPKPVAINVNKKFLILNTINLSDFLIPEIINGQDNHFATNSFENLPNKQYFLDFSNKNNVIMKITNENNDYHYIVYWDIKMDPSKSVLPIKADNYYGFYFKNKDDYKILDTAPKKTGINKYYYLSMKQKINDNNFYLNPYEFVSYTKGSVVKDGYLVMPLQKLNNLQLIPGHYIPDKDSKITYKNKITGYDPDNEISFIYYSNEYLFLPNENIANNQESQAFKFDTLQKWDSKTIKEVKLNYPGEKDYDLDTNSPIYKTIDSSIINEENQSITNLYFYKKAIDENKKPLIFTLFVTLANQNKDIKYTFNISDVLSNVNELRLVWNTSSKEMQLFAYNYDKINEIKMHKIS